MWQLANPLTSWSLENLTTTVTGGQPFAGRPSVPWPNSLQVFARSPEGHHGVSLMCQDFRRRARRLMSTGVRPLALASVSWRSSADTNLRQLRVNGTTLVSRHQSASDEHLEGIWNFQVRQSTRWST